MLASVINMRTLCNSMYRLEYCQSVGWRTNTARHIQWDGCEQEAISLQLCALFAQGLKIPQLSDMCPEEGQEVLVQHYEGGQFQASSILEKYNSALT